MKLYRAHTLYTYKLFRRMRYGRGNGVHSPHAYNFITQIARPRYPYYEDRELHRRYARERGREQGRALLPLEVGRLWFAMCARMRPRKVLYLMHRDWDAPEYGVRACKKAAHVKSLMGDCEQPDLSDDSPTGEPTADLLFTDSVVVAKHFLEIAEQGKAVLLLPDPKDRGTREDLLMQVEELHRGTLIDFFTCMVALPRDRYKHIYRSTL